jgi:hypothetical protein
VAPFLSSDVFKTGHPADAIERAQQACFKAQMVVAQSVALRKERDRWRALWRACYETSEHFVVCCAYCGRVRTLDGDWVSDVYHLRKGRGVEISHGLCQDCLAEHYPRLTVA